MPLGTSGMLQVNLECSSWPFNHDFVFWAKIEQNPDTSVSPRNVIFIFSTLLHQNFRKKQQCKWYLLKGLFKGFNLRYVSLRCDQYSRSETLLSDGRLKQTE